MKLTLGRNLNQIEAEQDKFLRQHALDVAAERFAQSLILDEELSDEERLELIGIYPRWQPDEDVAINDMRRDGLALYRCIQAHRTQSDWRPADTPSMWNSVVAPNTIGAWKQPLGSHDAYGLGALVTHNGQTWISTFDGANIWEPGVFGWAVYQA